MTARVCRSQRRHPIPALLTARVSRSHITPPRHLGPTGVGFRAGTPPTPCPGHRWPVAVSHHLQRGALNGRERKRIAALPCASELVRNRNSVHGRVPSSIWTHRPSWQPKLPDASGVTRPCKYACGSRLNVSAALAEDWQHTKHGCRHRGHATTLVENSKVRESG